MNDPSRSAEPSDSRVEAALREYLERLDRGEPIDRDDFLARHAMIAEQLRTFIAAEDEVRKLAGAETPPDRAHDSTKSFAGLGQETIAPQSVGKRAARAGVTGLVTQFGRYRIIRALGKGAMGTVYLAEDTQLQRQIALKTPHFTEDPTGEQTERFLREARAAGNLRHPGICPIHDVGQIDGKHYISMAYIEGRPLSAFIQPDKLQTERQILIVIRKLALALQEAHDHGIVHRDLKPANIMVDTSSEPIIMDFGLAHQVSRNDDVRLTQTGNILGTPAFMSPEQVEGELDKIGPPTDQYSLGVILYELLTGQLPFRGSVLAVMAQILTKEPPPPSRLRPDLDLRIEAVCLKMMARTPSERFGTLKAVADELAVILKSPAAKTTSKEKPASSPGPSPGVQSSAHRTRAGVGSSQVLKSLKQKAVTESDLASLEELARKCYSRRDFEQVIQIIERIPDERRNSALQSLLEKSRGKTDDISFLICDIDEAVRLNDRERALKKADELLKLKPGHHRALKVQEEFAGYGEGGAARVGLLHQFTQPWNEGGWIPWSLLAFGLAVFGVMTAVVVIYLNGTAVKIDVLDPNVVVAIRGTTLTITGPDKQSVKVVPGDQELTITCAGLETKTKSFTIKKGETRTVTVSIVNKELVARLDNEIAPPTSAHVEKTSPSAGAAKQADSATEKPNAPQLLVAPFDEATAKKGQETWAGHLNTGVHLSNAIGMKLVLIPPGEFQMGSTSPHLPDDVRPVHRVRITKPFYMGIYEVTQEEYQRIMASNPSESRGDPRLPVESLSGQNVQDFCRKLSAIPEEKQGGRTYRLPTEAEWEYACRAGTTTRFHFGDVMSSDQANFDGENPGVDLPRGPKLGRTTKVGSYRPNAFGLYDMHGNVIEVVSDSYSADYYSTSPVDDPQGPTSGDWGVARGGSWSNQAVPSAYRYSGPKSTTDPGLGFRVVCDMAVLTVPDASTASAAAAPFATDGFVQLFNRKDLAGWNVYPEGTGNWKVEDGILIGSGPMSHLFSKRGDYRNFRFRVEAQINDRGNSGQYFRTQFGPGFPKGYEAQIDSTHRDPIRTGSLYGFKETEVREMLVPPGEWFTQEVTAIGNHIVIKVNGKTTVDYQVTDPNKTYSQGHFALQQHDSGTVVKFRKIEVLELPPASGKTNANGDSATEKPNVPQSIVAPFDEATAKKGQETWARHLNTRVELTNAIGMQLRLVPPGEFTMGSPDSDSTALKNQKPQHRVRITRPFYLGAHEITRGQFAEFIKASGYETEAEQHGRGSITIDPKSGKIKLDAKLNWRRAAFPQDDRHPVVNVSWNDAQAFCGWLSQKEGKTYRLPTEAEWEYACRAGTTTKCSKGDREEDLVQVANVNGKEWQEYFQHKPSKSLGDGYVFTAPVGSFLPNAFGLFDMHGNVWEWCQDFTGYAYTTQALTDPTGPASGAKRVCRGGGMDCGLYWCRSAARGEEAASMAAGNSGFRVARDVDPGNSTSTAAPSADRRAAGLVLSLGGSVAIRLNGQDLEIGTGQRLPDEAFQLTHLHLHEKPELTDTDLQPLEGVANLIEFDLRKAPNVTDAVISHLRNSAQLESFWFEDASVADAGLVHLERLTKLKSVSLANTHVTDAGLVHLEPLLQLDFLALGGTRVTDEGLVHLKGLTRLTTILLERTKVADAGLVHLSKLPNLKGILLWDTRVTDAGLVHLRELTQLEGLMLGGTHVTDTGLASLKDLTSLKTLWLDRTRITDVGLARIAHLTNLEELSLSWTRVKDAGLARLSGLQQLKRLWLWDTQVTNAGLAHLGGLHQLNSVWLGRNHVTDAGLVHLKGLTRLRKLELSQTNVTAAGAMELNKSLPECEIDFNPPLPLR